MEVYKQIEGYDNYSVSDLGNVRNDKTSRILKLQNDKYGYLYIILSNKGKTKAHKVHRLVTITFLENPENKSQVNHINNIRNDNRLINLEWSSPLENTQHAVKQNRWVDNSGENHGCSKLNLGQVNKIRQSSLNQSELAKTFNISTSTISRIKNLRSWIK